MTTSVQTQRSSFTNQIVHGDCIQVMHQMAPESADFILTDPPYLVNYRDRSNRTIQNDASGAWLKPAMREAYRVLACRAPGVPEAVQFEESLLSLSA